MKKHCNYFGNLVQSCLLILVCFSIGIQTEAQSYLQIGGTVTPYSNNNGNLGIGTTSAQSRLHIRSTSGVPTQPLLKTEVLSQGTFVTSVQNCVQVGDNSYGIYQTSNSLYTVYNYFQDPVTIGKATISDDGTNSLLTIDPYVPYFKVCMTPSSGPATTPLIINGYGIRVSTNLVTDQFQMLTNPGQNKILVSDNLGNGTWSDLSRVLDYWKPNGIGDIYTDYRRVGIGTSTPSEKLVIFHNDPTGGLLINQTGENGQTKSEIKFNRAGAEKWAIGNTVHENRECFFIWSNIDPSPATVFYINGANGNIGIGNNNPIAKLDVSGTLRTESLGIGIDPPVVTNDYKLWVEGGIAAREVKVTSQTFPDYCFDPGYKLISLDELRTYITLNKHLPGFPSADEVKKENGFELGAVQLALIQKVEEQTLYILKLQEEIEQLKKDIAGFAGKQ